MKILTKQLAASLAKGVGPLYTVHGAEPLLALEAADRIREAARKAGATEREIFFVEPGFDWARLAVRYQLTVPGREEPVIAPTEIEARRLITYVESAPIAKEAEEQLLYKDMQVDLARQILRHIAAVKREM